MSTDIGRSAAWQRAIRINGPLQWHHNGRDSVSNHQPHACFLNRLFRHRSKETSKLRVTGLCAGNSPEAGEFPAQMASNEENVSIWWRHYAKEMPTSKTKAKHIQNRLITYGHIRAQSKHSSFALSFTSRQMRIMHSLCKYSAAMSKQLY